MVSSDGNSASASDCGVCCAQTDNTGKIENNEINNERIFISGRYRQKNQIWKPGIQKVIVFSRLFGFQIQISVNLGNLRFRKWNSRKTGCSSARILCRA